ncbi:MAG: insulinase family protein [Phycisphaeraceae bacterium]|nr:insulinase family protein [Phycisphaeraceae bacterium]
MPIEFQQRVLPNGLTIIAETDPRAATTSAGFFVKTGARDEESPVMGVSHFLEHMMFKGTETISAEQLNRAFDEIGAKNNAYTTSELTCFYASSLPEHSERSIELLARMMRPALRQSDFDTEKSVILEEIAMYKDNPFFVLFEAVTDRHYSPHPLGHRVLGTAETIKDLTSEQMRRYFGLRYSADNTIVSLAGRIDFDHACEHLASLCGDWAPTAPVGRFAPEVRYGQDPVEVRLSDAKVARGYLLGMAPAPAADDDRRYAAAMLSQILGAPDNSRLHWALVESGLAEDAQSGFDAHDGAGDYYIFAAGEPGRMSEILSVIQKEIAALAQSLTEDDLDRLRNKVRTAATVGGERPGDRMQRLGRSWTALGRYESLDDEVDRIGRVTLQELRSVAEQFPLAPATIGILTPATAS